jgi:hypothetical protein
MLETIPINVDNVTYPDILTFKNLTVNGKIDLLNTMPPSAQKILFECSQVAPTIDYGKALAVTGLSEKEFQDALTFLTATPYLFLENDRLRVAEQMWSFINTSLREKMIICMAEIFQQIQKYSKK